MPTMHTFRNTHPNAILLAYENEPLYDNDGEEGLERNQYYYMEVDGEHDLYYRVTEYSNKECYAMRCDSNFVLTDLNYLNKHRRDTLVITSVITG